MRINEIEYKRLDVPAAIASVVELTGRLQAAASESEAVEVLLAYSKLERTVMTTLALSSIRASQNTADAFYEAEEQYYAEATPPLMEKLNGLYKAMLESTYRPQLEQRFGKVAFINAEIALKTISPEILGMMQEESLLEIEYQKLQGALTVEFRGETYPVTKMGKFKTDSDRATRKEAFEAEGRAYLAHKEEYDQGSEAGG